MSTKLPKQVKLKSEKQITLLFKEGKSFTAYPLRFHYIINAKLDSKVLFSAPKRLFKKAVDRNRAKRILREGYRKHERFKEYSIHLAISYLAVSDLKQTDKIIAALDKGLSELDSHFKVR
jgi:ribonuclease P protein component